jgi:hypothetical protein
MFFGLFSTHLPYIILISLYALYFAFSFVARPGREETVTIYAGQNLILKAGNSQAQATSVVKYDRAAACLRERKEMPAHRPAIVTYKIYIPGFHFSLLTFLVTGQYGNPPPVC